MRRETGRSKHGLVHIRTGRCKPYHVLLQPVNACQHLCRKAMLNYGMGDIDR